MGEKDAKSDLLKRKFGPISDWKPATQSSLGSSSLDKILNETVESAKNSLESLVKTLEPLTEGADEKVKKMAASLESTASKSSKEAREYLAKALETIAEKIKPD
jgi:hypothetical protein